MQNIAFPFTVTLAGDSIWDYEGPMTVTVTNISIHTDEDEDEGDVYTSIYVEHDAAWNIYTDTGFEAAISEVLGFDVAFTEQGMQEDGCASMEAI